MKKLMSSIRPYKQAIPDMLLYQIVTKAVIAVFVLLFELLFRMLLKSTGRVALTSGDFKFLFTSWQGILIILLGIAFLFMYFAFDLNTKIVMSRHIMDGEKLSVWKCFKEGAVSAKRYFCARGIILIIFITVIAPIAGMEMLISLTEKLQIPNFVMSVIDSKWYFSIPVRGLLFVFFAMGIVHIFILHGMIIEEKSVKDSAKQSRAFVCKNWKNFALESIKYIIIMGTLIFVSLLLVILLPWVIIKALPLGAFVKRWLFSFVAAAGSVVIIAEQLLVMPMYIMHITKLFYSYRKGGSVEFPERPKKRRRLAYVGAFACLALCLGAATVSAAAFDDIFYAENKTVVVAHRAGGSEGPENTVAGLEKVADSGIYGCEIDIQRTSDGQYVINHDNTFERVAGVNKAPDELTLEQCRQLKVDGAPVSSFEEMLDACHKHSVVLFTELKGKTADKQMADDAVRIVREKGMQDEVVFISLKYDLIEYIEDKYHDMKTGYLTFASFGETESLKCDYLAIEEEIASPAVIEAIHDQRKKVMVWTPNTEDSQKKFLLSDADAIITDKVFDAQKMIKELDERSDQSRLKDEVINTLMG